MGDFPLLSPHFNTTCCLLWYESECLPQVSPLGTWSFTLKLCVRKAMMITCRAKSLEDFEITPHGFCLVSLFSHALPFGYFPPQSHQVLNLALQPLSHHDLSPSLTMS